MIKKVFLDSPESIKNYHKTSAEYGINHNDPTIKHVLSADELVDVFEKNRELINITKPFLYELYTLVSSTGIMIHLLDKNGIVLFQISDPDRTDLMNRHKIQVGADMSINSAGTNAVGISLVENIPCQIKAEDHYLDLLKKYTCSCAPIHDEHDEIIGFINLSGDSKNFTKHVLGLVVTAANSVKNHMLYLESLKKIDEINSITSSAIDAVPFGIITTDISGKIVSVNSYAKNLLNDRSPVNQNIYQYFTNNEANESSFNIENINSKTYVLRYSSTPSVFQTHPILNDSGIKRGYVVLLYPAKDLIEVASNVESLLSPYTFNDVMGNSTLIRNLTSHAKQIANSPDNILIEGEDGVGKSMIASCIHNYSDRGKFPFVDIDCRLYSDNDLLKELFGNTESIMAKIGLAKNGTLLIKNIDSMSVSTQGKLYHYINLSNINAATNCRIIATAQPNLQSLVQKNEFDIELYYELSTLNVVIPPLRERREDIPYLINFYLQQKSKQLKKSPPNLSQYLYDRLQKYDYPSNVFELKKMVERIVELDGKIDFDTEFKSNHHMVRHQVDFSKETLPLAKLEEIAIINALKNNNNNYAACAKKLCITRATLYNKLRKY